MKFLKVLGWIFVPYVMIGFQWNKIGKTGKVIGSVWTAFALIGLIVNLTGNKTKPTPPSQTANVQVASKELSNESSKQDSQSTTSPTPSTTAESSNAQGQEQVSKEPTVEDKVKKAIVDAVKDKTNMKKDRLVDIKANTHHGVEKEGAKIVLATLNADENFTSNMAKGSMLMDSSKVFKALFDIPEVEEVVLLWQLPLTDAYGKTEDGGVLKVTLTREIAAKINWDNFDWKNYTKVAADYWEHPALKK